MELKAYFPYANRDGFYHKSEVDKVIAEKDAEIARLKDKCLDVKDAAHVLKAFEEQESEIAELKADYKEACDRLQTANLIKDEQLAATRHSNHKRCLAMAKVCYLRFLRYENYLQKLCASNETIAAYKFRRDLYDKWEKRWLELAEKFKEAK